MVNRCKFWLPKKNRQCANSPLLDSPFCGNHTQRSHAQWIPCPIDPSHSVLHENLKSHLHRCPLLKRMQSLELQPFYQKCINAGDEYENDEVEKASVNESILTPQMKRNAVYAMTGLEFSALVAKIKSVHSSLCSNIPGSYKIPGACSIWTHQEIDKKLPYQEKHVLQQASILGNLEEFGALKQSHLSCNSTNGQCDSSKGFENHNDIPAVVEFGAGRGYLTQMLSDCYGIKKVVLVERKSYKLKADRSLRQKETLILERLRIDIEDLNLKAVEALQGVEFLAIGKHLCGPATDATLRCCISPQAEDNTTTQSQASYLKAIAIATCCHHLCLWKTYINKRYFSDLGFTKEDFHVISWFTSWAVDADHGSEFSVADHSAQLQIMWEKKENFPDPDLCAVEEIIRQMQPTDRAALGFMCKDIIDVGRLMWLESQGLKSHLVKYVPFSISPENNLLVART
ncbi:tRNA:m(4)X modification enzyme TRM13 [Primulina huaijiensis]|uniref:tRNA:m(4)X modification enzyme TRM13 n=1 Tax=Primulina huaijiensis TaxID=1492673 RepID=UPI003CC75471